MSKSIEQLDSIVDGWVMGNITDSMQEIKKLSRNDRARIIPRFRTLVSTVVAFEIAEKVIKNEY